MNEYQQALANEASAKCGKASQTLKSIDFNLFLVEGCSLEYRVLQSITEMLDALSEEYYQKANAAGEN